MYYFIFMVGEYEDRDPVFMSSDLDKFKRVVKIYIKNWYANGCDYDHTPNDIVVMRENHYYVHWEVKSFNFSNNINFDEINKLFEDIKNYVEEK